MARVNHFAEQHKKNLKRSYCLDNETKKSRATGKASETERDTGFTCNWRQVVTLSKTHEFPIVLVDTQEPVAGWLPLDTT